MKKNGSAVSNKITSTFCISSSLISSVHSININVYQKKEEHTFLFFLLLFRASSQTTGRRSPLFSWLCGIQSKRKKAQNNWEKKHFHIKAILSGRWEMKNGGWVGEYGSFWGRFAFCSLFLGNFFLLFLFCCVSIRFSLALADRSVGGKEKYGNLLKILVWHRNDQFFMWH